MSFFKKYNYNGEKTLITFSFWLGLLVVIGVFSFIWIKKTSDNKNFIIKVNA